MGTRFAIRLLIPGPAFIRLAEATTQEMQIMKAHALRPWLSPSLFALALLCAGCNDDNGTTDIGTGVKRTNKEVAQTTKAMNQKVADELSPMAESLEDFGNTLQKNAEDATFDVKSSIESKLPDVQKLADAVKSRLNAGDDDAKQAATSIDEKLADLKTKLTDLGTAGATATKDMKEDAADAFKSLVDNIQRLAGSLSR
jgi:hypothetical protein